MRDRVALVTGGSKGIGFGIAAALAAEGARVALASRDADRIRAAADRIGPIDVYVANSGGPPGGPDPLGFTGAARAPRRRGPDPPADGERGGGRSTSPTPQPELIMRIVGTPGSPPRCGARRPSRLRAAVGLPDHATV